LRTRNGLDKSDRGTLAIGAGHGNHMWGWMPQPHALSDRAHAIQTQLDVLRMLLLDKGEPV